MKILQVNKFNYGHGGADHYFLDLCDQLSERGHTVARFCMHHPNNRDSRWSQYFVSHVDYINGTLWNKFIGVCRVIYSIEARKKFARLCDDFQPDVIHVHNIYHQISPSILSVARKRRIPVIMHLHDYKLLCPNYDLYVHDSVYSRCLGEKYYRCILDKCFKDSILQSIVVTIEMYLHHTILNLYGRSITRFVAPSHFIADLMKKHRPDLTQRIRVISYGVQMKKTTHRNCSNTGDKPYYVTYGYFHKQKGFDIPIKALVHLPQSPRLIIIGSGDDEDYLHEIASRCGIAQQVHFTGRLTREEIDTYLSGAVATIVPSRWLEVFGLVIPESFAAGTCVIGATIGAIPELVTDRHNGLLFQSNDDKDLAKKMAMVLTDQKLKGLLDANAAITARKHHDPKAHLDSIISLYEEKSE